MELYFIRSINIKNIVVVVRYGKEGSSSHVYFEEIVYLTMFMFYFFSRNFEFLLLFVCMI